MLHRFFEKHIGTFDEKDAVKLIDKHVDKAKDLCSDYDKTYLKELALAAEMIEDLFQVKGLDHKTYLKTL